ncbi:methyltransferase [Nocardia cyriacigeorgica]|uniref:Putative methyltransferase n=1 Tax=Nocardia cyriacigeorgica TaxID=135487 RepID=A0A4U8W8H6_9NOCA|nr:class I SAM-dependent methyltransferase [Nocardia cyriacigeorgica]VFB00995.1 putative methyltransferase [Nocardia cyriacigeorgica]
MAMVQWTEDGSTRSAHWHSESDAPAPARVVVVDDRTTAKSAYRMARNGMGLLWRGDFHNARQLLRAVDRLQSSRSGPTGDGAAELFHRHRAKRTERARVLGRVMVLLEPDHSLLLRRAPDVRAACDHAYGATGASTCVSLTELLGVLGAYQWHRRGVEIEALGARIHPAYGVFSPVRGEYIDLVAETPFNGGDAPATVFDLGTGTGVLAAVLARRGARQVVGTDINPRAVDCASANMRRLGFADRVQIIEADLWPNGRADLVVCNPPWLPAQPSSDLELGIYDPDSDVLHRFLDGLAAHLTPAGEGWLVLSDLAEHLGLRPRGALPARIAAAGLRVVSRHDTQPRHARATDAADPLHDARRREVTSLWRLVRNKAASTARG